LVAAHRLVRSGDRARSGARAASVATFLVLGAITAPAAQAAPTWLGEETISIAPSVSTKVAMDPEGNAVAIWSRQNGTNSIIQAATRPAGGRWSPVADLTGIGPDTRSPQVAMDGKGNAVALWRSEPAGFGPPAFFGSAMQTATRPAGGAWSAPQTISNPTEFAKGIPDLAVNVRGDAVAIWYGSSGNTNGSPTVVRSASRSAGGSWSTPQELSTVGQNYIPQVVLDAQGDAVAVWANGPSFDRHEEVKAATRSAGGSWTPQQQLSVTGEHVYRTQVAVDPAGNAVAVWHAEKGTSGVIDARASVRPFAGGSTNNGWAEATTLSDPGSTGNNSRVEFDAKDDVFVAFWTQKIGGPRAAVRAMEGSWSPAPGRLLPEGGIGETRTNSQGDVAGVWSTFNASTQRYTYRGAGRQAGGPWSAPQDVSTPQPNTNSGGYDLAIDGQGNAVAAWAPPTAPSDSCSGGSCNVIRVAGFDAAGPQLRALDVPAAGVVDSSLAFAVAPVDVWSQVSATRWDFGDGASADGVRVSHRYAAAGVYEVTLTSTDSLGNATALKRTVVIASTPVAVDPGGGSVETPPPGAPAAVQSTGPGVPPASTVSVPASAVAPASGAAQSGGGGAVVLSTLEQRRASALRRCLAAARRPAAARRRTAARRRCVALFGRTPARVTGLRARVRSATDVVLRFRAPGVDNGRGAAARSYVVKQSLSPMRDKRGIRRARTLCGGGCRFAPARVGATITLTITDLLPRKTYYYVVAARDSVSGRLGPASRVVRVQTR